jgi:hypothetical protein
MRRSSWVTRCSGIAVQIWGERHGSVVPCPRDDRLRFVQERRRFRRFGCVGSVSADQLGHARPSMTQDVSMGRKAVDARVAEAMEDALGEDQPSQGSAKNCE